jgi:hypothetical protein
MIAERVNKRKYPTRKYRRLYSVGCVGSDMTSPPCSGKRNARAKTKYTDILTRNTEKPRGKIPHSAHNRGLPRRRTERST